MFEVHRVGVTLKISGTVTSVFEGMSITFSHLVRRPMTIQYPDKIPVPIQETLPQRYRGFSKSISISAPVAWPARGTARSLASRSASKWTGDQADGFTHFDIDICKCMYCGLCAEACPTGSIRHSQEFEGASYSPAGLVRHFATQPSPLYKPKKGGETDPTLAKKVVTGLKYLDEFAAPDGGAAAEEGR